MTNNLNHNMIAHRYIDMLINNATDELHDRDRDDIADAIAPHLDNFRALMIALHDTICTEPHTTPMIADADDDELDHLALDLDNQTTAACISLITDAIYIICYHESFNRD